VPWCEEKINYSAEMYLLLGDDRAISGEHEQAAQFYREALRREPDYARAHDHLGVALAELGQYREAAAQLDEALIRETDPDTRFAILFNRAHARTLAGDLAGALRDYDAALVLRPEAAQAYFRRGAVYHDLGEYGPARRDWEEVLNSSPPGDITERARSRLERLREEGH
jgi:tetratricopeptide (TPR) repeat protein